MKARLFLLLLVVFAAFKVCPQEEIPFTRIFDTGVVSADSLADEAVAKRTRWKLVPEDKLDHAFTGDPVFLNDKLAVVLRKQGRGAEVYSKTARGFKLRASVGHVGANSATPDSIGSLKILENNSGAVMVQAVAKEKPAAALSFRLTTGEPIIEIRSSDNAESVSVYSKARYVVVPDYFGDDVVFDPTKSPGQFLPAENMSLNLLEGGDAILMSVWQSSEQDISLAAPPAGQQGELYSTRIHCLKGKSIWLAFLESPALWHAGEASAKGDWKPPFAAKWRCSLLRQNGIAESSTTEKPEIAVPKDLTLIYPIDRSTATPLTATCPTDIMRNTLGVGPCQYILACEGMAAQGDPTPNAVMNWVEKQFEQKKQRKAAEDIKERLDVMVEHVAQARARMQSYAEFARQIRKLLANKQGADAFRSFVDDMERFIAAGLVPTASPERAKQLAGDVSGLTSQENTLEACRRIGEQLRALGAVQDSTLAKCRMAVRRLRAQGKTIIANQPESILAQDVQKLAEQMLHKK